MNSTFNKSSLASMTSSESHEPGNVLFLIPQESGVRTDHFVDEAVRMMARELSGENFVYVASKNHQQWMDDEAGVRHLPFEESRIPRFGRLTTAYVVGDEALAVAVATEHPEASVFVMRPGKGHEPASVARKLCAWAPVVDLSAPELAFVRMPAALSFGGRITGA